MATSEVQNRYAPSGGAKIHFLCAGSRAPLVFPHAGVLNSRMWDPQIDTPKEDFRPVRYDHRGFGKSAFVEEPFALRDALLSVLRYLAIERAALVGCSMGAAAAIDFTLERPDDINSILRGFLAGAEHVARRSR